MGLSWGYNDRYGHCGGSAPALALSHTESWVTPQSPLFPGSEAPRPALPGAWQTTRALKCSSAQRPVKPGFRMLQSLPCPGRGSQLFPKEAWLGFTWKASLSNRLGLGAESPRILHRPSCGTVRELLAPKPPQGAHRARPQLHSPCKGGSPGCSSDTWGPDLDSAHDPSTGSQDAWPFSQPQPSLL